MANKRTKVTHMSPKQRKAVMAAIRARGDKPAGMTDRGKTPHEMIEGSLLYGVDRYTARGEELLQRADVYLGIDPEIGRQERHQRGCERETLFQLDRRGIVANHLDYLAGMRGLLEKGDIRKKASGKGYMITPQGRRRIKEIDAAVLRHFKNVKTMR